MNVALLPNVETIRNVSSSIVFAGRPCGRYCSETHRPCTTYTLRKKRGVIPHLSKPSSTTSRCACVVGASSVQEIVKRDEDSVSSSPSASDVVAAPPTYVKASGKIIAIGDLHGDLQKTIRALEIAQVISQDENGMPRWSGGNATVVQLGDVLDRGDCEIGILMLLRDLDRQAQKVGGAVHMINGNHESLNVCGNFRYVTRGAFYECALAAGLTSDLSLKWEDQLKARLDLYSPGGLVARELAKNPTVLVVNDTVFAHGGLLPIHANYGLERINREMSAWMRGDITDTGNKATPPYIAMGGPNSILWNRTLAQEKFDTSYERYYACSLIKSVLKKVKAKRLVVGHTPQMSGCNSECSGQIWRVDIGMSEGVLNAEPQVMSIDKDELGNTVIEVIRAKNSPSLHSMKSSFAASFYSNENNIQAAVGFESVSVYGHRKTIKWVTQQLVSRLSGEL